MTGVTDEPATSSRAAPVDPSDACPSTSLLVAFMGQGLREPQRREVEEHCNTCETCRATLSHAVLASARHAPLPAEAPTSAPEGREAMSGLPLPGTRLGRYVLLQELGRGAMGVVHAAYDPDLDRKVALKVLHAWLRDHPEEREQWRTRLVREARALASMTHTNVITIYDVGTWNDDVFIAMELIDGTTLASWLRQHKCSRGEILGFYVAAGRGLAAAHRIGLVHRDFKPDNVLVARDGSVRVSDFGLVRFAEPPAGTSAGPPEGEAGLPSNLDESRHTRAGSLIGTPAYMSPEQLQGLPADARSDQYSFCVALYEGLFGARPFAATTREALLEAQRKPPRRGESVHAVPARVWRALVRGLSYAPEQRFASMDALLAELARTNLRTFAAACLLGTGIACGLAAQWLAPERDDCRLVRAQSFWNDDTATAVEAAVTTPEIATRVTAHLQRSAESYEHARNAACHTSDDAVALCLEMWTLDFTGIIERLETHPAADIADGMANELPDPGKCHEPRWMPALPSNPEVKAHASERWLALHEIRRAVTYGQLEEAASKLDLEQPRVQDLGNLPLRAEAETLACELAKRQERLDEAPALCVAAARSALAAGHHRAFEQTATSLSWIFTRLEQYERSRDWLDLAQGARAELGLDENSPGLVNQRIWLLGIEGHYAEAVALAERTLEQLPPDDRYSELMLRSNIVKWLSSLEAHEEAEATARWAVERATELYGADHMNTLKYRAQLAALLLDRGDSSAASQLEQVIDAYARVVGPGEAFLAYPYFQLATARFGNGESQKAIVALDRAMALVLEHTPDAKAQLALMRIVRGQVLADLGRESEALSSFDEARVAMEIEVDGIGLALAAGLLEVGMFYSTRGKYEQAAPWLRRAKAIGEKLDGPDAVTLAQVMLEDGKAGRNSGSSLVRLRDREAVDAETVQRFISLHDRFMRTAPQRR